MKLKLKYALGVVFLGFAIIILIVFWGRPRQISSQEGRTVIARVYDKGSHWGADFYVNIVLLQPDGRESVIWKDPNGQQSSKHANELVSSIEWVGENRIEFFSSLLDTNYVLQESTDGVWVASSDAD